MDIFLTRLFSGITSGTIYAIVALALVIVFRANSTINFAQGEFALFTTYIAWMLNTLGIPLFVSLLGAMVVGFILGAATERVLIRPVHHRSEMAILIVCLGLFTGLNGLAGLIWGSEAKVFPSLFPTGAGSYVDVLGARLNFDSVGVVLFLIAIVGVLFFLFNRTNLGLQMRAVATNAESAALSGVRTGRVLMVSWGLSAVIGSIAGVLLTPLLPPNQLGLQTMFPILIYASAAALFGGLDSVLGAVVGGVGLGVVESMINGYLTFIGGELPLTVALVIIVLVLLVRPTGMFGRKQEVRV